MIQGGDESDAYAVAAGRMKAEENIFIHMDQMTATGAHPDHNTVGRTTVTCAQQAPPW